MIIDLILNKIYELDIIKTLNENKLYNSNFIESKQKFLSILYKSKEEIQASSINNCRPDERIDKYTQAYELYNKHTNDCFNNYDNYLQDFINFKYIYNLLCDKTKEQIVNYIDSDIEIDADANVIDADANEIVADANEIVADDIEQKVNKLYDRLQRGTCYARDGVLILYHLKDITKGFVDGNERNEVEKKAILRKAIISTNGIVPKNIRCTNGQKFGVFINNYIKPFLDTPTPDIPLAAIPTPDIATPALSTSAIPVAALPVAALPVAALPVAPTDEWDSVKQFFIDNTISKFKINSAEVQYALTQLRAYIKNYFKLKNNCISVIEQKKTLNDIRVFVNQNNKLEIKKLLCGRDGIGGKKSKQNKKRKTQKQNRKTRRHR